MNRRLCLVAILAAGLASLSAQAMFDNGGFDFAQVASTNIDKVTDSLSMWGDPIDLEADRRFKTGSALNQKGGYEQARQVFVDLLSFCAANNIPLHVDQFDNILLRIAYCLGDSKRDKEAIAVYNYRLDVLSDANNWRSSLPQGLQVLMDKGEIVPSILAGLCHQDRSIARTIVGDYDGAWEDMLESERILEPIVFEGMNYHKKISSGYFSFLSNAYLLGQMERVPKAFDKFQASLLRLEEGYPAKEIIMAFRFARNASAQVKNLENAKDYSMRLIEILDKTKYSDQWVKDDYSLNEKLKKIR